MVPSVLKPQLWSSPVDIDWKVSVVGGIVRPYLAIPQQTTFESDFLIAQLWLTEAEMAMYLPVGGVDRLPLLLPQQWMVSVVSKMPQL